MPPHHSRVLGKRPRAASPDPFKIIYFPGTGAIMPGDSQSYGDYLDWGERIGRRDWDKDGYYLGMYDKDADKCLYNHEVFERECRQVFPWYDFSTAWFDKQAAVIQRRWARYTKRNANLRSLFGFSNHFDPYDSPG